MGVMGSPKGQPYVYKTYDWPEGPAIIHAVHISAEGRVYCIKWHLLKNVLNERNAFFVAC